VVSGLVVTVVWAVRPMFFERVSAVVFGSVAGPFKWLTLAGLPARKRAALQSLWDAMRPTDRDRRDQRQLDDAAHTIKGIRDSGLRIQALEPPDDRWVEVFKAAAAASLEYANMLEGKRSLDYEEAKLLVEHRNRLIRELLRHESLPYRILTYTPRRPKSDGS
jgi:hypothetical protein